MRRHSVIWGLFLLVTPLPAASTTSTSLYDIEVLVFENNQAALEGGEAWRDLRKETGDTEQVALPEGTPAPDSVLSQIITALERDGHHRVLVHKQWQQNADAKTATIPLRLQSDQHGLDGTLRFYLSHFLHIELALSLQDQRTAGDAKSFQINEHRRIRPQEIHYFDHPRLGALVRVSTVPRPESTPRPVKRVKPSR